MFSSAFDLYAAMVAPGSIILRYTATSQANTDPDLQLDNNDSADAASYKLSHIKGIVSQLSVYRKNVCMWMINDLYQIALAKAPSISSFNSSKRKDSEPAIYSTLNPSLNPLFWIDCYHHHSLYPFLSDHQITLAPDAKTQQASIKPADGAIYVFVTFAVTFTFSSSHLFLSIRTIFSRLPSIMLSKRYAPSSDTSDNDVFIGEELEMKRLIDDITERSSQRKEINGTNIHGLRLAQKEVASFAEDDERLMVECAKTEKIPTKALAKKKQKDNIQILKILIHFMNDKDEVYNIANQK
ncbi:hypothetical protein BDF20DRAFT_985863 [Mycotypha africana]|uniref:uncharacterized protein n=1 Tax=Mycotypha africana TaxID=64632 RepID=UPI0023014307|nr:uncharacterized protein BDF20DRAFT_985863 [Mycotypha africana]KAI8988595.1 hypothetical protein BDF20DRAFT_985863 [Mycotypha africana]